MYKFILTALLNIGDVCLFAQFSAIEIETNNVLYSGIRNKISIAAENTSCKFLVVKTTNGSISGGNCQFVYSINFMCTRCTGTVTIFEAFRLAFRLQHFLGRLTSTLPTVEKFVAIYIATPLALIRTAEACTAAPHHRRGSAARGSPASDPCTYPGGPDARPGSPHQPGPSDTAPAAPSMPLLQFGPTPRSTAIYLPIT